MTVRCNCYNFDVSIWYRTFDKHLQSSIKIQNWTRTWYLNLKLNCGILRLNLHLKPVLILSSLMSTQILYMEINVEVQIPVQLASSHRILGRTRFEVWTHQRVAMQCWHAPSWQVSSMLGSTAWSQAHPSQASVTSRIAPWASRVAPSGCWPVTPISCWCRHFMRCHCAIRAGKFTACKNWADEQ